MLVRSRRHHFTLILSNLNVSLQSNCVAVIIIYSTAYKEAHLEMPCESKAPAASGCEARDATSGSDLSIDFAESTYFAARGEEALDNDRNSMLTERGRVGKGRQKK
jgi:hypothetical protein